MCSAITYRTLHALIPSIQLRTVRASRGKDDVRVSLTQRRPDEDGERLWHNFHYVLLAMFFHALEDNQLRTRIALWHEATTRERGV